MDAGPDERALARLDPAARSSPRRRLAVGGVVLLVLTALVAAVVMGLVSGGRTETLTPLPGDLAAPGAGSTGEGATEAAARGSVFIHVLGAVERPGLYELGGGSRVIDAIAAAGGFADTADQGGVNLARIVSDGEQLYVPVVGELPPPAAIAVPGAPSARINLNTATVADLDTLPGIGPGLAQRILDWRAANGRFASVDDLHAVTGIGEKTFAELKDLVTV